jgi:hypothetical protein
MATQCYVTPIQRKGLSMFETIVIKKYQYYNVEKPLNLGMLAEVMLYYHNVILCADRSMLNQLLKEIGPELLIDYLQAGFLKIQYMDNFLGVITNNSNTPFERYNPVVATMPHTQLQEQARASFNEYVGKSGRGRRLALRFLKNVDVATYSNEITDHIRQDYEERSYVHASLQYILKLLAPEYNLPEPLIFNVHRDEIGFFVETNLDFNKINDIYHKKVPPSHSSLSTDYVLSLLANARGDIFLSSNRNAEIVTDDVVGGVIARKLHATIEKRMKSESKIIKFNEFNFKNSIALQEVINRGEKSFKDLYGLLKQAKEFKKWLKGKNTDAIIIEEYLNEIKNISWLDNLPAKTARWSIITGFGLLIDLLGAGGVGGTLVSTGISAADAFILDRIIKGWCPNQFVENSLRKFIEK